MAQVVRINLQIRANRPDSRESLEGSRTEPFFCESRVGSGLKIANRRFEAIRTNCFNVMKIGSRAAKRGCFKRGGFPIWTFLSFLFCPFFAPFLSFFGTFPIFPGFSRFARGWSGDFPDVSFSSFSAY